MLVIILCAKIKELVQIRKKFNTVKEYGVRKTELWMG